jgi:MSHA pilin protein MshC
MKSSMAKPIRTAQGFTLPELIAIIIIAAILFAVAAPRFVSGGFDNARLYHETTAALRYAQSTALATQRTVCAAFTATSVTLTYAAAYGSATCDTNLVGPTGATPPYKVLAQGSSVFSIFPASVSFDRAGHPSAGPTITVSGFSPSISIDAESGYVY